MKKPLTWDSGEWDAPGQTWDGWVEDNEIKNMSDKNRISGELSQESITAINNAIAIIRQNLTFLISLTAEQRRKSPHLAEGGAFLEDSLVFANQHPEALPAGFDLAEFNKDGALDTAFRPVVAAIKQLAENVDDTSLALASDRLLNSLDIYAVAKAMNRSGAYDTYVNAAKAHFAQGPRQKAAKPA